MQLENLRQKRNALRARTDEGRAWAGSGPPTARGVPPSDAAALAAAARRRQQSFALISSSSSDSEEGAGAPAEPVPTPQELTAKLFAKLGIKGGSSGKAGPGPGFESDSSWASSPEPSGRIRATLAPRHDDGAAADAGSGGERRLAAELGRAQGTIAALQRELAAARAQADEAAAQFRAAEGHASGLTVRAPLPSLCRLHAGLRRTHAHASLSSKSAAFPRCEQTAQPVLGGAEPRPIGFCADSSDLQARLQAAEAELAAARSGAALAAADASAAGGDDGWGRASELAAANAALQENVAELAGQLAAAAAWQEEVAAVRRQLDGMAAAVADSEAERAQREAELAAQLAERERQLLAASASLAAAEAQLDALAGGGRGRGCAAAGLRPAGELLAALGISQAQLAAALGEAAALLA
jgi:hypothetical protein